MCTICCKNNLYLFITLNAFVRSLLTRLPNFRRVSYVVHLQIENTVGVVLT